MSKPEEDHSTEALIDKLLKVIDRINAEIHKIPVQLAEGPAFSVMSFREKTLWRGRMCNLVVEDIAAHIAAFKSRNTPQHGIRIYWKREGSHVHTRWFTGKGPVYTDHSLGKSGDLVFTVEEWNTIKPLLSGNGFLIAKG